MLVHTSTLTIFKIAIEIGTNEKKICYYSKGSNFICTDGYSFSKCHTGTAAATTKSMLTNIDSKFANPEYNFFNLLSVVVLISLFLVRPFTAVSAHAAVSATKGSPLHAVTPGKEKTIVTARYLLILFYLIVSSGNIGLF